jgi:hypothetical protein
MDPDKRTWLDVILDRGAKIAQIVLVPAGIAGYFLTVQPIHQKERLDEQIAERTKALERANATLDQLTAEAKRLGQENTRLVSESDLVYRQLRSNLAVELFSVGTFCIPKTDAAHYDGKETPECVLSYARDHVTKYLRPLDQVKLTETLESHRQDFANLPRAAAEKLTAKAKQANQSLGKVSTDEKRNQSEFEAEIRRLRQLSGLPAFTLNSKGPIELAGPEETNAYLKFDRARIALIYRRYELELAKGSLDLEFWSAHSAVLRDIMKKVVDEFRAEPKGAR